MVTQNFFTRSYAPRGNVQPDALRPCVETDVSDAERRHENKVLTGVERLSGLGILLDRKEKEQIQEQVFAVAVAE